ncbi:MAG: arginine deiminase [Ignavibacteria bacterium]|nr:MAG: arginine deiminase [Ignavibacteria bacterium]
MNDIRINVSSEIGKLNQVIIHTPGEEVENMTPRNAERALYSDILNLTVAQKEYSQFKGVLKKVCEPLEIRDLLKETLHNNDAKRRLLKDICSRENQPDIEEDLYMLEPEVLAKLLIEGVPLKRDNLTNFLSKRKYALRPLHNFFFTRDSASAIRNKILINRMKSRVRSRESKIIETIMKFHPKLSGDVVNPESTEFYNDKITIEGGDVQVARGDVLVVGIGSRTSTYGVDFLLEYLNERKICKHIIAQELPHEPESFIHLDMVFTFLDVDKCMVYSPVVFNIHNYETVHIEIDNGKVKSIHEENDIPTALRNVGIDVEPIFCGGEKDEWTQEREQWHSGANFFAFAPGKVIGYSRNIYTLEEMNKHGFEIIHAKDVIKNKVNIDDYEKCVVTIDGSELARGGGGARCMTMPINRDDIF